MGRVALPLEEIRRGCHTLATHRGIARSTARPERVQSRAQSATPILAPPRDRRQADDLGVGELQGSGLAEKHLGRRWSKGHASRNRSGSLGPLLR